MENLAGSTCTLSSLSHVLLRVLIEFLFAVLAAEIVILTLIVRFTGGSLVVNFHVAHRISMHGVHDFSLLIEFPEK